MDRVTQRLWRGVEEPSVRCSAQDDDFVGGSKASGRDHLRSFSHTTRKLVVIEIAAGQQKQPDLFSDALLKTVNKLHRQKPLVPLIWTSLNLAQDASPGLPHPT